MVGGGCRPHGTMSGHRATAGLQPTGRVRPCCAGQGSASSRRSHCGRMGHCRESEFPLSPQVHWPTRITEVTAKSVKVRGLHDGTNVAILLEYNDPSEDPEDAAALEFMVGDTKAHFAHGQPMAQVQGGPVNIWYWKNKDGKGVDMGAKGFGTLKPHAHQDVKAKGVFQGGVLESRVLSPITERSCRRRYRNSSQGSLPASRLQFGTGKRQIPASLKKRGLKKRFRHGGTSAPMRHRTIRRTCMHYSRWPWHWALRWSS